MKRVLLVNTNREQTPYPVPPLGLAMLAAKLEGNYDIRIFDGVFNDPASLPDFVRQFDPHYIGFSIRNVDDTVMDRAIFYIADIINEFIIPVKESTSVPIILGGSGFSIFPEELMALTGADYGIIGEGETLLSALLHNLDNNQPTPKLLYPNNSNQKPTTDNRQPTNCPLQPNLDLRLNLKPYLTKGVYSIQSKRGCKHGCIYCTYPNIEGRNFRIRDPEEIAAEVKQVYERLGTITVEFVDSTFNDPAGHAEDVCRAIIRTGVKMRFRTMGINPRHSSPELFRLMKEAGFVQIDATPDSASPRVLKNLKKGFTLDEIRHTAEMIKESDLPTMWFFLFGGPGEDESTVSATFEFIDRYVNPEDMVYMSAGLRIYPNTPLYRIALKEGIVTKGADLLYPSKFYFSKLISKERLDELMVSASRSRPNCIPAQESAPPPEMMAEAMEYRKKCGIDEPMFRTLLRIRREWLAKGKQL